MSLNTSYQLIIYGISYSAILLIGTLSYFETMLLSEIPINDPDLSNLFRNYSFVFMPLWTIYVCGFIVFLVMNVKNDFSWLKWWRIILGYVTLSAFFGLVMITYFCYKVENVDGTQSNMNMNGDEWDDNNDLNKDQSLEMVPTNTNGERLKLSNMNKTVTLTRSAKVQQDDIQDYDHEQNDEQGEEADNEMESSNKSTCIHRFIVNYSVPEDKSEEVHIESECPIPEIQSLKRNDSNSQRDDSNGEDSEKRHVMELKFEKVAHKEYIE